MRHYLSALLFGLGVLLLLPAIYGYLQAPSAFKPQAFQPLIRIPLLELTKAAQPTRRDFVVPQDEEIGAIDLRRRYIVTAAASERLAHCWKKLQITVSVASADRQLPIHDAEGAPYTWSSKCPVSGVWFSAPAGGSVHLTIQTNTAKLPPGELMVLPFWQSEAKDRIVGLSIHESIIKLSWYATPVALLLLIAGAYSLWQHIHR